MIDLKSKATDFRGNIMIVAAFLAIVAITIVLGMGMITEGSAAAGFLFSIGGMFARNIGTAFDFEFGSSKGSASKNEVLNTLLEKPKHDPKQ